MKRHNRHIRTLGKIRLSYLKNKEYTVRIIRYKNYLTSVLMVKYSKEVSGDEKRNTDIRSSSFR